jgi:hypothetical protein
MTGRRLPLILGLAFVVYLVVIWVPPALDGGPTISCAGISQAECDEAVPGVLREAFANVAYAPLLPVTNVHVVMEGGDCSHLSYDVTWRFGFRWSYPGCL